MSKESISDWNLQRLTLPIEVEGTTIYRPFPSGDLLLCVDDNEGTVHSTLEDLQLYEQQRRLISYENLIGCMIEILFNKTEWRLALVLSFDTYNCSHTIQFILRNATIPPPNSGPTVTEIPSSPTTGGSNDNRNRNRNSNSNSDVNSNSNHDSNSTKQPPSSR